MLKLTWDLLDAFLDNFRVTCVTHNDAGARITMSIDIDNPDLRDCKNRPKTLCAWMGAPVLYIATDRRAKRDCCDVEIVIDGDNTGKDVDVRHV